MTTAKPSSRKRRFAIFACVVLALALLALAAVRAATRSRTRLARAIENAASKGLATSVAELEAKLPVVPPERNAAILYEQALEALGKAGSEPTSKVVPILGRWLYLRGGPDPKTQQAIQTRKQYDADPRVPLLDFMLADAKTELSRRQSFFALVRKASELPDSKYRLKPDLSRFDGLEDSDYERQLMIVRQSGRWIALAAWIAAEEGDTHEAAMLIADGLALADSLRNEPLSMPQLMRGALFSIVLTDGLCRSVARAGLSNDDLALIQKRIKDIDYGFSMRLALEGDIAAMRDAYEAVRKGDVPLSRMATPALYISPHASADVQDFLGRLPLWVMRGSLTRDVALSIEYLTLAAENVNAHPEMVAASNDPISREIRAGKNPMALSASDVAAHLPYMRDSCRARMSSAMAALAALRYKSDNGRWPVGLGALVPAYLSEVPMDPFVSSPLLYKVDETGITVYTVGANKLDEGGKGYVGVPYTPGGDDVGLRIWREER